MKINDKEIELNIYIQNFYKKWIPNEDWIRDKIQQILSFYLSDIYESSCLMNKEYDKLEFDITFTDSETTHRLNKQYRDKDYAADILTFAVFADDENRFIFNKTINLGEIIISMEKTQELSNKDISKSKNKEQELMFLLSHGLMHLLGFDHQTIEEYDFVIKEQFKALESIDFGSI